jgi:hypothetical protein
LVRETHTRSLDELQGDVRRLRFRHDPAALFAALQHHRAPPPHLVSAPYHVEIELVEGALETRWSAGATLE